MNHLKNVLILLALLLASVDEASARKIIAPQEYGRVIIANYSDRAGLAPVVFDHWWHRSQFTCRLCHVDIGFAMAGGGTEITAVTNKQGLYCGSCHNGKRIFKDKVIFASCSDTTPRNSAVCDRCHSLNKNIVKEHDFKAFSEKMPKRALGNSIDWEAAEGSGLIKPVDFLEGIAVQRPRLKPQKDFSIEAKVGWVSDVVFSHKKHAVWNGCEVCHPEIFPVQKGATRYTMIQIDGGAYCGVCHGKVAFPIMDCQRCHTGVKK